MRLPGAIGPENQASFQEQTGLITKLAPRRYVINEFQRINSVAGPFETNREEFSNAHSCEDYTPPQEYSVISLLLMNICTYSYQINIMKLLI